jgi:serine protease AprX
MRRCTLPLSLLLSLVLALTVALSLPGGASAGEGPGGKIEKRLEQLAGKRSENAEIDVILRGPDSNKLFRKYAKGGKLLPLIGAISTTVKVKDLDKLAADPDVKFMLADAPVRPQGVVDYSKIATTYPFADRAHTAWDKNLDGRGVGIAVIDSGVAPVADFGSRLVQVPPDVVSRTVVEPLVQTNETTAPLAPLTDPLVQTTEALIEPVATTSPTYWPSDDVHGHGSLVAGIAGGKSVDGKFIGIAPGAGIYALNVNRPEGVRSSDVIDALQWVHENAHAYNIRVVNLSLTESLPSSYKESVLDLAIERVWAAGLVVVVSAGNGGPGAVDFAPANDPLALTVGSTDNKGTRDTGDDVVASFTAMGRTVDGYSKPEVLAPGRLIASTLPAGTQLDKEAPAQNKIAPGYATISGTSFSAPQVAGAAALLFQKNPGWSPDNIKWALVEKSRSLSGGSMRTVDIASAVNVFGPSRANQGVLALVCAPGTICLPDNGTSTVASSWSSATWNSATWNSATWNSATWNSATWSSATWNSATWNSATWNSATWNSATWNSATWNSATWNQSGWS